MSNLKELTKEQHTDAERQAFVKVLMSGRINPEFYATYLWNQHKKYDLIEALATAHGLLADLPIDIRRKLAIEQDFLELWKRKEAPVVLPSTDEFMTHMKDKLQDPDAIMAHVYVLHMGDLSGGQMIARKTPGEGRMYKFEGDIASTKEAIRAKTHDGMAEEARKCFEFSTKLFQELMELDIEHYLD